MLWQSTHPTWSETCLPQGRIVANVKSVGHIYDQASDRYIRFSFRDNMDVLPCQFKVNVMAKVDIDGHIWGLVFDRRFV